MKTGTYYIYLYFADILFIVFYLKAMVNNRPDYKYQRLKLETLKYFRFRF